MRRCPPICAVLAATFASCASAPAPQSSDATAKSSAIDSADIERTRKRRLDELRVQLASQNAQLVAWAAWRCGDEHITDVRFELRQAAQRRGWRADSITRDRAWATVLDALVQIGSNVTPEEVRTWRDEPGLRGPLLVLASRAKELPVESLLAILDEDWSEASMAQHQAAGNLLAAQRSPSVVDALLGRAVVIVRVDVVDPGGAPGRRGNWGVGMPMRAAWSEWPPQAQYVFETRAGETTGGRIAGPVDVFWSREIQTPPATRGDCVPFADATSSGRTYSADLLEWLADPDAPREPFGDLQVIVDASDLAGGRERVLALAAQQRARWMRMISGLERAGLLAHDSERGREPRIAFDTRDWRADKSLELPDFGR